jgi:hypothetical protein
MKQPAVMVTRLLLGIGGALMVIGGVAKSVSQRHATFDSVGVILLGLVFMLLSRTLSPTNKESDVPEQH